MSKCIRFCSHIGVREYKNINQLHTKESFEQCTATSIFKFFNNSAPSCMAEMFLPVGHSQITQRSKNKLNQPFRKSNKGQNGLSYLALKIWNNLHSDLKSAESVNNFKHKIKDNFFKEFQKREDNPYEYC